jgi:hypothetical protein
VLSRSFYWMALLVFVGIAAMGILLIPPPDNPFVDQADLQQFYFGQSILAAVVGTAVGLTAGISAPSIVFHGTRDRAQDFDGRVAQIGLLATLIVVLIDLAVMTVVASVSTLGPLGPAAKAVLAVLSTKAAVTLAISAAMTLATYAVATRSRAWGGQYSLIRRF